MAKAKTRRRERKSIPRGRAYIQSTFNNTLVTLTDPEGNVIASGSGGTMGFKGARKGTAFAAQRAAEVVGKQIRLNGVVSLEIEVRGPGSGRESAIRGLNSMGFSITKITDVTPIPHNGCRPPKRRRV